MSDILDIEFDTLKYLIVNSYLVILNGEPHTLSTCCEPEEDNLLLINISGHKDYVNITRENTDREITLRGGNRVVFYLNDEPMDIMFLQLQENIKPWDCYDSPATDH